jgi:hypothetical protein
VGEAAGVLFDAAAGNDQHGFADDTSGGDARPGFVLQIPEIPGNQSFFFKPAWARTAGGGRPEAAARLRSRIVIAAAAAIATHPAPTISARRTVGAPITTGHTPMRVEDPTV